MLRSLIWINAEFEDDCTIAPLSCRELSTMAEPRSDVIQDFDLRPIEPWFPRYPFGRNDHMRNVSVAIFATFIVVGAAYGQEAQSVASTAQATTPIAGIDNTVLARSARAAQLIGNKVFHGDTSIGQIEDVLVDLDSASVVAVILSVGGFLGVGEKLVAVPVNQIKLGKEARFTTDLTKDEFARAPAFDFGHLK